MPFPMSNTIALSYVTSSLDIAPGLFPTFSCESPTQGQCRSFSRAPERKHGELEQAKAALRMQIVNCSTAAYLKIYTLAPSSAVGTNRPVNGDSRAGFAAPGLKQRKTRLIMSYTLLL